MFERGLPAIPPANRYSPLRPVTIRRAWGESGTRCSRSPFILPAGTVPPNPQELLSSKRFEDVLSKLKDAFDIVVIDSAPLQLVSDALVLSQFASSVIYVVKADSTPYQVAQNGLKKLRRVNAPVLGIVLNQLDIERAEKYYGEYSGYKSYRGYKKYGYTKAYGQE